MPRRHSLMVAAVLVATVASACGGSSSTLSAGPRCIKPDSGHGCLEIAARSKRVDLRRPTFSNPTSITNPLYPLSGLTQVLYGGQVDGKPFRTEFTRLPGTTTITWNGRRIKTVTMQYLAFANGRIDQAALDWFAQADDGAVWYLGEKVALYKDGVVTPANESWMAGKEGPGAMNMPGHPKVGDVYRPENIPGVIFEEVRVKSSQQTVDGPRGPVRDAIVVTELHQDNTTEDKTLAPGYGEFATGDPNGDLEALSLALPIDARSEPVPAELVTLSAAVRAAHDNAAAGIVPLQRAWDAYRATGVPPLLERQMSRDVTALAAALTAGNAAEARDAALRVAQNDLDLQSQFRPVAEIDRARIDLWTRQVQIDTAANDAGAVAGDKVALGWTRARLA